MSVIFDDKTVKVKIQIYSKGCKLKTNPNLNF